MIRVAVVEDDAEVQGVLQAGWTFWTITAPSTTLFFWMWR